MVAKAFLEHTSGDPLGELVELDRSEMLIGRTPGCDIVIEPKFTSVSQRHAVLRKTPNGWVIVDVGTYGMGSSYGTYVNDIRIAPNEEVILHPGDEIRLGTKLGKYFRFHGEGTMSASEPTSLKGRFSIDPGSRHILVDGRVLSISLTPQEFELLAILWQQIGSVCTFKEICTRLWPDEKITAANSIDADLRVRINTLAHSLRRKLSSALDSTDIVESCRGVGYRLCL